MESQLATCKQEHENKVNELELEVSLVCDLTVVGWGGGGLP